MTSPALHLLARVQLDQLWPPFVAKLLPVLEACQARGFEYKATSGYRTFAEQLKLWAQGRTVEGRIVTDAGPGESAHNYGLAVDVCRWVDGAPSWRAMDYEPLGEEAKRAGLLWGGEFHHPDRPHVQLAGYVSTAELAPLKSVYLAHQQTAPLSAVFEYLNQKEKPHG